MPFVVYQYLDSDDAHTFYEPLDSFESVRDLKAAIPGLLEQLIEGLKQIGYTEEGPDLPGGLPKSTKPTVSLESARLSSASGDEVVYAFDNECGLFVVHDLDDAESELEDYDPADDDYKALQKQIEREKREWDKFTDSVASASAPKKAAKKPAAKAKLKSRAKAKAPSRTKPAPRKKATKKR